jgi:FAD:protein FMN transferase
MREPADGRFAPRRCAALLAGFALASAALLSSPTAAAPRSKHPGEHDTRVTIERARILMGTTCTMTAEGQDSSWTSASVDIAMNEIDRLDDVLSSWKQDSELNRLNSSGAEQRIQCSPDLYAVTDSSLALARATDGAFDPTIEPYNRAWDMRGAGRVPDASELADARERVGYIMVQTEPGLQTVRFRRDGMGLDFGGIGKGYALDHAAEVLRQRKLLRVLLNFGGELEGFTDGEAWVIEIADPADRLRPIVKLVLRRGAVSTSGQGERGVTVNGRHYGHILDPHTGQPLDTDATVTVVARTGTLADGLSTALLVMGREKAAAWCAEHPGIGALWLERANNEIRAWRWNLPTLTAEPGVKIEWMQ